MKKLGVNKSFTILLFLSLITIFLRLLTLMEVSPGGDNIDYWYYGKAIINQYQYGELFHRNIRWGILIPVTVFQMVFGTSVWVIYLIPITMAVLLNISIYKVGKKVFNQNTAYLTIIIVQIFPYMIRVGSQLFLALFSMNYLLLSFYFLLKYLDKDITTKNQRINFTISVLLLFIAYETKITNLYFLIPFLIIIYRKKSFIDVVKYSLILLGLYFIEHFLYFILAGYPLGRLQIIMSTHFGSQSMTLGEGVEFNGTFLGLFERFSLKNFPIYWHLTLWGGLLSGFILKKIGKKNIYVTDIIVVIISFTIIQTLGVKSISPFIPFEDFIVRYFMPILPLAVLLISELILVLIPGLKRVNPVILFSLPVIILVFTGLFYNKLPNGAKEYINNPIDIKNHNLVKTIRYEKELNELIKSEPIACVISNPNGKEDKRDSHRALDSVNRLFLKLEKGVGKYETSEVKDANGTIYKWIVTSNNSSFDPKNEYIRVYRMPFEYKLVNQGNI
ncbi:MAG: glycosyltransferase family 39 protein [Spirochaetales bacterium]|nr:glycosyltransferase family 39 protein [Spirochaetales bacterium]